MRTDAVPLEESRLTGAGGIPEMPHLHERHRAFRAVFENRQHQRILDVAAGMGYVANRIHSGYPSGKMFCNDISPTCLKNLHAAGIPTVSYNLDGDPPTFPFADASFDAVVSLATIEHIIQVDNFVREICRILTPGGYLYLSAPNYASLLYLREVVLSGRTFHDPMQPDTRYEFYAHVRYFTYRTMLEYVSTFGLRPDTVYLPLPQESTTYRRMYAAHKTRALGFRYLMKFFYTLSPRWASEPILCFRKDGENHRPLRKVLL